MDLPDANALANGDLSSNALAKESIAYRFESQSVIDDTRARRENEWKDAYARWVLMQLIRAVMLVHTETLDVSY